MSRYKKFFFSLLKILISVIAFYIVIKLIDFGQFKKVLKSADPLFIILSFGSLFTSLLLGFFRWVVILKKYGQYSSLFNTGKIYFMSFYYNVYLPGGILGDIARGYKTSNEGFSKTSAYSLVLLDRMFGVYGLILIGLLFSTAGINRIPLNLELIIILLYLIFLAFFLILFFKSNRLSITRFTNRKPIAIFNNSLNVLTDFFHGSKNMIIASYYSILTGLTNILAFYYASKAVNLNISLMVFLQLTPIVLIVSLIPISFKGLGLRESTIILLFSYQLVDPSSCLAFSIIYSINIFLLGLSSAGLYMLFKYVTK